MIRKKTEDRDGNGAEQGRRMGSSPPPRMDFSYSIPPRPACQGKFLAPYPPLKAPRRPTKPHPTL